MPATEIVTANLGINISASNAVTGARTLRTRRMKRQHACEIAGWFRGLNCLGAGARDSAMTIDVDACRCLAAASLQGQPGIRCKAKTTPPKTPQKSEAFYEGRLIQFDLLTRHEYAFWKVTLAVFTA